MHMNNSQGVLTPRVESFPGADCPYVKPNICTIPPPPTAPCCVNEDIIQYIMCDLHDGDFIGSPVLQ